MRAPAAPRGALWALPFALCFAVAASCGGGSVASDDDDDNAGENGNGGSAGSSGGNAGEDGDGGTGGSSGGSGGTAADGGSGGSGTGAGSSGGNGGAGGKGGGTGGAGGVGGGSGGAGGDGGGTGGAGGVGGGAGGTGGAGGVTGGSGGMAAGGSGGSSAGASTGGSGGATGGAGGSTGGSAGDGAGGSAGAGPVTCGTSFAIAADGFVRAPAAGGACWHGYAMTGGDPDSVVTPTSFSNCGVGCVLRATGIVNAANDTNNYAGVVFLGFNLNQAPGTTTAGTVTPTGNGLALNFTNTGGSGTVRIQISQGTSATTRWCADLTAPPTTVPYSRFNTACWNGTGTTYANEPIDTVQIVIPGAAVSYPFDFTLLSVKDT